MPIPWDRPLVHRRGAGSRLVGLDVYYDFDWRTMFMHDRAVFPRGKSLAQLVVRDCPDGKTPALLLTERIDVQPSRKETEDRYIVIVPIRDYLRNAGADAASTYYARLSGTPLTQLTSLADVTFSVAELEGFLDEHLTAEALARWVARSQERMGALRDLVGTTSTVSMGVADAIRGLGIEDVVVFEEFARYLERLGDSSEIRGLLARITRSEFGRTVTANVLADRLPERIADTRRQLVEYQELITSPGATETDVQRFLERNPWIVGLPYVRARARVKIPRGELDFVLDRFDGFFDVVELKGPQDPIIIERSDDDAVIPPSASAYSLCPALAKALAQAHHYRALLDQSRNLHDQYGLADTRQPRILIVLGCSTSLTATSREVLRQLNLSLHRVEVIPYDLLGTRTAGLLDNLESLLNGASAS